jgi:hypothetical protein
VIFKLYGIEYRFLLPVGETAPASPGYVNKAAIVALRWPCLRICVASRLPWPVGRLQEGQDDNCSTIHGAEGLPWILLGCTVDACDLSPGRIPESITVAATDVSDSRWVTQNSNSGSNYGQCVDLFAPGVAITSAFIESPTATISATGTLSTAWIG